MPFLTSTKIGDEDQYFYRVTIPIGDCQPRFKSDSAAHDIANIFLSPKF